MSFAVDVNVLVHASAASSPHHRRARDFLDRCVSDCEIFGLPWCTVVSYLRFVTHAAVLSPPLAPTAAEQNIGALLALPHVRLLTERDGFWDVYRNLSTIMRQIAFRLSDYRWGTRVGG